jgi:hypothetical protein
MARDGARAPRNGSRGGPKAKKEEEVFKQYFKMMWQKG